MRGVYARCRHQDQYEKYKTGMEAVSLNGPNCSEFAAATIECALFPRLDVGGCFSAEI